MSLPAEFNPYLDIPDLNERLSAPREQTSIEVFNEMMDKCRDLYKSGEPLDAYRLILTYGVLELDARSGEWYPVAAFRSFAAKRLLKSWLLPEADMIIHHAITDMEWSIKEGPCVSRLSFCRFAKSLANPIRPRIRSKTTPSTTSRSFSHRFAKK